MNFLEFSSKILEFSGISRNFKNFYEFSGISRNFRNNNGISDFGKEKVISKISKDF
jgi:hypothetical protein